MIDGGARWHQDLDNWVWRVYGDTAASNKSPQVEATLDIYIIPDGGLDNWHIVDASELMSDVKAKEKKGEGTNWIAMVSAGAGKKVAGPFTTLDAAKAAWRLIYG